MPRPPAATCRPAARPQPPAADPRYGSDTRRSPGPIGGRPRTLERPGGRGSRRHSGLHAFRRDTGAMATVSSDPPYRPFRNPREACSKLVPRSWQVNIGPVEVQGALTKKEHGQQIFHSGERLGWLARGATRIAAVHKRSAMMHGTKQDRNRGEWETNGWWRRWSRSALRWHPACS